MLKRNVSLYSYLKCYYCYVSDTNMKICLFKKKTKPTNNTAFDQYTITKCVFCAITSLSVYIIHGTANDYLTGRTF